MAIQSEAREHFLPVLCFVELSPLLRSIGAPHPTALERGYDPKKDRQIAVFGSRPELEKWRQIQKLDPKLYPIHDSKMGTHIDVYDPQQIGQMELNNPFMTDREYLRYRKINKQAE